MNQPRRHRPICATLAAIALAVALPAAGQEKTCPCPPAAPPPPDWTGGLGAGLAVAGGNSDSRSYSLSLNFKYDPKRKDILRLEGAYLRADQAGTATLDRTWALGRDEHALSKRAYTFQP
jgi:hypothetical protein